MVVVEPPEFVAVTVYVVAPTVGFVGVPLISPVAVVRLMPAGSEGEMLTPEEFGRRCREAFAKVWQRVKASR